MARLPTAEDLGGAPSLRSSRPIASFDTTAIGEGLQDLARGLGGAAKDLAIVGERQAQKTDEANRFNAQRSYLEFVASQEDKYNEMIQNAEPGAIGFHEQYRKSYFDDAKEWLKGVPDDLKPQYDLKLFEAEERLGGQAETFEYKQRTQFFREETSTGLAKLENQIAQNPQAFDDYIQQGIDLIDANPNQNLAPIEREAIKKDWIESAHLRRDRERINRGQASQVKRELMGESGSFTDKVIGVESGGQADAKNPLSSAYGPAQFIKSTWRQFIAERHPDLLAQGDDIYKLRSDKALSREGTQWYAQKNSSALQRAGLPVTDGTLYLAHFAGPGGAIALLNNPTAMAKAVLDSDTIKSNPFLADMTAAEVVAWAEKKMGGGTSALYDYTPENRDKLLTMADRQIAIQSVEIVNEAENIRQYLADGNVWEDAEREDFMRRARDAGLEADRLQGIADKLGDADRQGEIVRQVSGASNSKIDETLDVLSDRVKNEKDPEKYVDAKNDYLNYQKVASDRLKAVATDSAQYALTHDETVNGRYEAFQQAQNSGDMEAARAAGNSYAAALTAYYDRLEIPPEQRRILTQQQAQLIARQFADMETGSQDSAQLIQALQAQWGDLWPQIHKDIAPQMPSLINVAASMPPGLPAERVAMLSTIDKENLEKQFDTIDRTKAKEEIVNVLQDFGMSLPRNVNQDKTYSDYYDAIYLLALDYARRNKTTPQAAVQDAYDDIIGDHYTFEEINGMPLPIPNSVDVDGVFTGAVNALGNVESFNVDLPSSAVPDDETRYSYELELRNRGYWLPSSNEDGVVLYDSTDAVVTKDGKPVHLTWQQLLDVGQGKQRPRDIVPQGTFWPGQEGYVDPLAPGAEPMRR